MDILGYPNGECPKHGLKISVNGVPTCLKCQNAADQMARTMVLVNDEQDPGAEELDSFLHKSQTKTNTNTTFEGQVTQALTIMRGLPMPSDVKQFKAIQKIIGAMQQLIGA